MSRALFVTPSHLDYFFRGRQELFGYLDRLIQKTARIASQVQYELAHAFLLELRKGLSQLLISLARESAGQCNVPRAELPCHESIAH